ncbi:hypothetical protein BC830DRAFT_1105275 [Chytriomyces sp. MP71]|nr:hypothetical protein BC830DRAFT_1105275 [Chytriomyces sp. MP71]
MKMLLRIVGLLCASLFALSAPASNTTLAFNATLNLVETVQIAAVRAVLSTGPPPLSGAYGTAIWYGQASAARFTAPSDVGGYGARLAEVQLTLAANRFMASVVRLSIVEDSGRNAPGNVILETRNVRIPAYDGRVTITASYPGNLYLFPGELFWVTLEGDARYVQDSVSWLDSSNGIAWTAFNAYQVAASGMDGGETEQTVLNDKAESAVGWVVERSNRASSIRVLVS